MCKVTIFYADQMCDKVSAASAAAASDVKAGESAYNPRGPGKFTVTPQQCLAINNIDYVLKFIQPFALKELGIDGVLAGLLAKNGEPVATACRRTLMTLVQNAVDNVENKMFEVLDAIASKMAPVIQRFLVEGTARLNVNGHELLLRYLDDNLIVLKNQLNDQNFDRILSVIWESSAQSLSDTIQMSIERRKPPSYFNGLLQTLKILINFFYGDRLPQDETLLKMKSLLQLYASDSADLIAKYLRERYREQLLVKPGEFALGSITIRCQILSEHLRIEVLNARHLKPPDPIASEYC